MVPVVSSHGSKLVYEIIPDTPATRVTKATMMTKRPSPGDSHHIPRKPPCARSMKSCCSSGVSSPSFVASYNIQSSIESNPSLIHASSRDRASPRAVPGAATGSSSGTPLLASASALSSSAILASCSACASSSSRLRRLASASFSIFSTSSLEVPASSSSFHHRSSSVKGSPPVSARHVLPVFSILTWIQSAE